MATLRTIGAIVMLATFIVAGIASNVKKFAVIVSGRWLWLACFVGLVGYALFLAPNFARVDGTLLRTSSGRSATHLTVATANGERDVLDEYSMSGDHRLPAKCVVGAHVLKPQFTQSYSCDGDEEPQPFSTMLIFVLSAATTVLAGLALAGALRRA